MDVAAHWQREWAGAAEFGKVTEGGVTRRVSRAVEVLNASAPGTRMRVMRAAYHSSSGPGVPTSSFMLHSSRRVISSGSGFEDTVASPSRPLEISSTPLDSSPDSYETENYKVTEPDDTEISEPSKWKRSSATSSIRMPSEESSSVDNASIIDLDTNTYRTTSHSLRKNSYDSDNSDIHVLRKRISRASPVINTPASLSTLKYKSLLNSSNDWNSRRKSYSFEDTSPIKETISHSTDMLAMESSTDSGICKSSEVVNDDIAKSDNSSRDKDFIRQSDGRVSITVPVILETSEDYQYKRDNYNSYEYNRKTKKVGFSKTELHFAAESGKVNIIATDEKPPPSYDFRKRRNVFVPINENFERPVTLFSDKSNHFSEVEKTFNFGKCSNEINDIDENTAATKSILKNKIPKPKPYLLGENMALGFTNDLNKERSYNEDSSVLSTVSLINRQLQLENKYTTTNFTDSKVRRTTNKSPSAFVMLKNETMDDQYHENTPTKKTYEMKQNDKDDKKSVNSKLHFIQLSPTYGRAKTRQLRESDLTYFGVKKDKKTPLSRHSSNLSTDVFQSVRLIQQVSNSLANSETGSEGNAEYENIDINPTYFAVPRSQTKNDRKSYINSSSDIYNTNQEQLIESRRSPNFTRPSRLRKSENSMSPCRSISEPPKTDRTMKSSKLFSSGLRTSPPRYIKDNESMQKPNSSRKNNNYVTIGMNSRNVKNDEHLYVNISKKVSTPPILPRRKTEDILPTVLTNTTNHKKEYSPSKARKPVDVKKPKEPINTEQSFTKNKTHRSRVLSTPESSLETKKGHRDESHGSRRTGKRNNSRTNVEYSRNKKEEGIVSENKVGTNTANENNQSKPGRINSHLQKSNGVTKQLLSERNPNEITRKDEEKIITDSKIKEKSHRKDAKNGSYRKPHRNEYVINYDDKNGTVSSVRKLKPEAGSLKAKNKSLENNKSVDQIKSKQKPSEKSLRK